VIVLPAVDIRCGRAVRLRQGDFADETVYADDPLAAARVWVEAGARGLHVVDLDGARSGAPAALEHLERITRDISVPVQYGGGLRTVDAVMAAFEAGAERVVVGTAALSAPAFLEAVLERFGARVAVAIDSRAGEAAVSGWIEGTGEPAEAAVARLARQGVKRLVYTDVDRDGMLEGPDIEVLGRIAAAASPARLTYSGGIGSLQDLRSVGALGRGALDEVISGKALYERRFTVAEAQAALDEAASVH
jgi:phosphoribosylformimino-5-aminoimidazole carboxamide ribotide isomerase